MCSVLNVSSSRGKHCVRFLCIITLLNKHILVKSMVWVWVVTVLAVIGPHSKKHDVIDNHGYVRWNVHLVDRFLCSNKVNFYSFNH